MTAPQTAIPDEIATMITAWGERRTGIDRIDADLAKLDVRISEDTTSLRELCEAHAAMGRQRTELQTRAELARRMAEEGCRLAGIPLPVAPAGGDQPAEPGFQPEPRPRAGGRRG